MPTSFRRSRALIQALISASLVVLAFEPTSLRFLVWIALVPLFLALRSCSIREAVLYGGIWGMACAIGITEWLPSTVATYYRQPLWLGLALFSTAAFLMGGIYYALFAGFYRALTLTPLFPRAAIAGAAWVAAELGRARLLTGNPWGLLGYTQAGASPPTAFLQIADFTGVYGISFLIIIVNVAVSELVIAALDRKQRSRMMGEILVAGCLLTLAFLYGATRLNTVFATGEPTLVALTQANLDLGSQWNDSLYGRNLEAYLTLTQEATSGEAPKMAVWPENAMTFFVENEPTYRAVIAQITQPADVELVAGAPRFDSTTSEQYYNSAFVIAPNGEITAHYEKQHLLPFAEYFPFGSINFLRRSFGRPREFTPGEESGPVTTRAGLAGVVICNEAMFPRVVRARVAAGAQYLINLSNDTWVQDPEFALHQFDIASLRAIEMRRYLVRASTSGPSGFVDAHGRIHQRTQAHAAEWTTGVLRASDYQSAYARYGDVFATLCLVVSVLVAIRLIGLGQPS